MALYRKYRPATFAEVVGQEHVTEPLSAALESGRINHAYLFSGPRGCGKTSSARILARSLNCVEGPTASPCGVCRSCVALGPGGAGNLDVVELDAASHGGVEDTRDLRDKAFYAPAESRYRVFIVDEAHMVSNAGFNALLKIVEEPPEHLIFVFATTEPEKVLPTIRSRTHHYPFRLLPPTVMRGLLDRICTQEGVVVEDAVFPLAIRAGGGSPRDTLSVLDQLLAGAGADGITYARALPLLGVTDVALIDDAVDALAVDDGATLFQTVNRLVEAGHDPRRFAADLLDRMRDLIVIKTVPDAGEKGIVDAPGDIVEYMRDEAERIGLATLTRYAEVIHDSLNDMRGATAPRLLLEVMCARLLLPAATDEVSGMLQRIEKLEQGIAPVGGTAGADPSTAPAPRDEAAPRFVRPSQNREQPAASAQPAPQTSPAPPTSSTPPTSPAPSAAAAAAPTHEEPRVPEPVQGSPDPARGQQPSSPPPPAEKPNSAPVAAEEDGNEEPEEQSTPESPAAQAVPAPDSDRPDATAMRAAWSEVRAAIRKRSRTVEVMLSAAVVKRVDGETVVLTHPAAPLAARLAEPHNAQLIREAVSAVYGGEWRLVVENDTGPAAAGGPPRSGSGHNAGRQKERSGPPEFSRRSQAAKPSPASGSAVGSAGDADAVQRSHSPAPRDEDAPPDAEEPYDDAAAEEEMMAEAAAGSGETTERRDPEEAAVELLRGTLGATPLDG